MHIYEVWNLKAVFTVILVAEKDHWSCLALCCLKMRKLLYVLNNIAHLFCKDTHLQVFWPLEVSLKASRGLRDFIQTPNHFIGILLFRVSFLFTTPVCTVHMTKLALDE